MAIIAARAMTNLTRSRRVACLLHMTESSPRRARKASRKLSENRLPQGHGNQFTAPRSDATAGTLAGALGAATDAAIAVALRATGGNRTAAARVLAVTPRTLYRLLAARKKAPAKEVS